MKITVIIPAYNEEKVIGECVHSLFDQTYPEKEIIVVDDGSSDKTLDVLLKFRVRHDGLRILKQDHKGPGAARNLGALSAKGKILVFVDADMTFDKRFLHDLVKPIIEGKTRGTTSKEEYVKNWDNIWARCWNINEGWAPKRRHRLNSGSLLRSLYDFIAFAASQRNLSLQKFTDYQRVQITSVFRALSKSEFERVGGYTPGGYNDDYSLGAKLGYVPVETKAKFFHANPASLSEVFKQARWIGKRKYKFSWLGYLFSLGRSFIPVSLMVGLTKSVLNRQPKFTAFKVVYDLGIFFGVLSYWIFHKGGK